MYTKEKPYEELPYWTILDPQGDRIIPAILEEEEANSLLSHLNRE